MASRAFLKVFDGSGTIGMADDAPGQALLVINDRSRQGRTSMEEATRVFEEAGIALRREVCAAPHELDATIRRLAGEVGLVVLGGGDGTLNSAALALADTGLPLGILPLGTANDLARTLGIPTDPVEAARVIVAGHRRRIDLGMVNGRPFFNVASLGLSVSLTKQLTGAVKRRWGRLGYAIATGRALYRVRPFTALLRHDGREDRVRTMQIAVGNGRYYGGGLTVEETARVDDAQLDVYSLEVGSPWKLALIYPAFRYGRHGAWREVRTIRCKELEIVTRRPRPVNTDGEITTATPARFSVRPQAVTVFAPPEAGG